MFSLLVHEDAKNDLRALSQIGYAAAVGKIVAFLQQIKADPKLLDALTDDGFGKDHDETFSIRKWVEQWNQGGNLWRLKIWGLEDNGLRYRILYAYEPQNQCYHILAVVRRSEFNYEPDHPITLRVLAAYRQLGIPTH